MGESWVCWFRPVPKAVSGHLKHLAMCAPMIAVAAILIAGGANAVVAVLPAVGGVRMTG